MCFTVWYCFGFSSRLLRLDRCRGWHLAGAAQNLFSYGSYHPHSPTRCSSSTWQRPQSQWLLSHSRLPRSQLWLLCLSSFIWDNRCRNHRRRWCCHRRIASLGPRCRRHKLRIAGCAAGQNDCLEGGSQSTCIIDLWSASIFVWFCLDSWLAIKC